MYISEMTEEMFAYRHEIGLNPEDALLYKKVVHILADHGALSTKELDHEVDTGVKMIKKIGKDAERVIVDILKNYNPEVNLMAFPSGEILLFGYSKLKADAMHYLAKLNPKLALSIFMHDVEYAWNDEKHGPGHRPMWQIDFRHSYSEALHSLLPKMFIAIPALLEYVKDEEKNISSRKTAMDVLVQTYFWHHRRHDKKIERGKIADLITEFLGHENPKLRRMAAIYSFDFVKREELTGKLAKLLNDSDPAVADTAVKLLILTKYDLAKKEYRDCLQRLFKNHDARKRNAEFSDDLWIDAAIRLCEEDWADPLMETHKKSYALFKTVFDEEYLAFKTEEMLAKITNAKDFAQNDSDNEESNWDTDPADLSDIGGTLGKVAGLIDRVARKKNRKPKNSHLLPVHKICKAVTEKALTSLHQNHDLDTFLELLSTLESVKMYLSDTDQVLIDSCTACASALVSEAVVALQEEPKIEGNGKFASIMDIFRILPESIDTIDPTFSCSLTNLVQELHAKTNRGDMETGEAGYFLETLKKLLDNRDGSVQASRRPQDVSSCVRNVPLLDRSMVPIAMGR